MSWWRQYQKDQPVRLKTLTAPSAEPVSSTEALDHLHLTENSEQAEVDLLMAAAREEVEAYSGRRIIRQQVRQTWDCFPWGKALQLAASPLFEPNSTGSPLVVRYWPEGSTAASVLSSTSYLVSENRDPPLIVLKRDAEFPNTELRSADGVEVDYWVGYSTSSTGAPKWAKAATLLTGAHWFANREAVVAGTVATEVPMSARSLMQSHRSPLAQV